MDAFSSHKLEPFNLGVHHLPSADSAKYVYYILIYVQ